VLGIDPAAGAAMGSAVVIGPSFVLAWW
jgi:hypothetical protein